MMRLPEDIYLHIIHASDQYAACKEVAEEINRLEEELEQVKDDHHKLGEWSKCKHCLKFFQDDENGAVLNAKLSERLDKIRALVLEE